MKLMRLRLGGAFNLQMVGGKPEQRIFTSFTKITILNDFFLKRRRRCRL
jgi:hypothetical protein